MSDFTPTIHGAGRARPTRIEHPPHPWGSVGLVESAPSTITQIMGEYHARRADLDRRRQDYSRAEFEREVERLADFYRQSIISRAEETQQHYRSTHSRAEAISKHLVREVPAADVDRGWQKIQPLISARIGFDDIARKFADNPATIAAIREYAPNTLRAAAKSLDSPMVEEGIARLMALIEEHEEAHLPPELAEARQAQRRVDSMWAVVAEHLALARREIDGERVTAQDKIAAGLREAEVNMADRTVTTVTPVTAGSSTY